MKFLELDFLCHHLLRPDEARRISPMINFLVFVIIR